MRSIHHPENRILAFFQNFANVQTCFQFTKQTASCQFRVNLVDENCVGRRFGTPGDDVAAGFNDNPPEAVLVNGLHLAHWPGRLDEAKIEITLRAAEWL